MIPSRRMPRRRFSVLAADISFAEVVTTHHKIDNPLKKEELTMKIITLAAVLLAACAIPGAQTCAQASAQASPSIHDWTGVWQITDPDKPGGMIVLADEGTSGLSGTIAFYVKDRETGQRIAIETRPVVNPHLEGNALVFQVRHILRPHLKGDPPTSFDPADTDVADMTLSPGADGKAILTCPKCGGASPTEFVKEH